jgi:hypothetical protein
VVVLDQQRELLSEHPSRAVQLVGGEPGSVFSRLREGRLRPAQRAEETDRDSLSGRGVLFAAAPAGEESPQSPGGEDA